MTQGDRSPVEPRAPEASLAELDPALQLPQERKIEILVGVLLVTFLSALDQTIVGVALPRIVGELGGTNELYTWVITSYLLTATITGVFYGKLSDIYGRRLMLLFGVSVFLLGSFLSALSWSMESLILFRGIQGVGAGAIFPISLAIIGDLFTPRERGRYQGLFGAVFGVASIIGPLLGGWLTDNLSWHWIFLVNLPIGAVTLYIIYRYLPSVHGEPADPQPRLPGRPRVRRRRRLPAPGPDEQADGRLDGCLGGRLPAHRRRPHPGVPVHRVARRGAHRAAGALPQPQLLGHHPGHLPGRHRLLRRRHLPAPLVPVRAGRQPHRVRPPDPAPAGRRHHQLHRGRRPGQPHAASSSGS